MEILNVKPFDFGYYDCYAKAKDKEVVKNIILTVQDVPNAPNILGIACFADFAIIKFELNDQNDSSIENYYVQYNTSFHSDGEFNLEKVKLETIDSVSYPVTPWKNYTFRLIVENNVGMSAPSNQSDICTTIIDIPVKNPINVRGEGTASDNLVIYWKPMSQMEHYAPGFQYLVQWKRDLPMLEVINYFIVLKCTITHNYVSFFYSI